MGGLASRLSGECGGGGHGPSKKDDHIDDKTATDKADPEDEALYAMVDTYLDGRLLDVPFVPRCAERHVYATVLRLGLSALSKAASGASAFGYGLDRIDLLDDTSNSSSSGGITPRMALAATQHPDAKAVAATTPETAQASERVISELVDRFVANRDIDLPLLPDWVERGLYANVLRLATGVATAALRSSSADILGHRLSFRFDPLPLLTSLAGADDDEQEQQPCSLTDAEERALASAVEERMATANVFLLPDALERHLYLTSLRTLLVMAKECVARSRVRFMGHAVAFRLVHETDGALARTVGAEKRSP